jgi:long-chain acyl-CoA synthetase
VSDELGITAHARATPDKPALVIGDEVRTFAAFDERTTRLARGLERAGVGPGDRVAVMLPNGLEFFEAWAAATKLGAPVVLVNWHLTAGELGYILADSGARLLVAHRDLLESCRAALAAASGCELLVVPDEYEAAIAGDGSGPPLPIEALDAPIFYTSGTTGRPKGVVHGRPDRARGGSNMRGQLALWGWSADDVHLVSGPAYHAGPGGWTMAALYVGATTTSSASSRCRSGSAGSVTSRRCGSSSTPARRARSRSSAGSSRRSRPARSPSCTG